MVNSSRYVPNQTLHSDFKVTSYRTKLGTRENPLIGTLHERKDNSGLKRKWPFDVKQSSRNRQRITSVYALLTDQLIKCTNLIRNSTQRQKYGTPKFHSYDGDGHHWYGRRLRQLRQQQQQDSSHNNSNSTRIVVTTSNSNCTYNNITITALTII